jgi:DNA-binding NtrC family response regulator
MPHILIVDDDRETVESLAELAKADGFTVAKADCLRSARAHLVRQPPDVLLTDLQLPDGEGTSLVADLEQPENTEVVVFTGHASMESAIRALRAGATDYLLKPIDIARLKSILDRVPRSQDLHAEIGELRDELRKLGRFGHILGNSPSMQQLYEQLARVSPTSATVLLVGESGTGKELCAQTIHEMSRRKRHPFLPVNCGAVSPQLIESELFGHEKGSFTGADRQHKGFFERANGGTIFLDEITEMPMDLQVKLLRVLETGTFMRVGTSTPIATDVRIIAATNRSPEKAVTDGRLREDLYHRLNVFPVNIPPLRERGTDIELLAQYFLDQHNREQGTKKTFSRAAIAKLYSHTWPGNVRELKNYVQRAFILSDTVIEPDMATSNFVEPDNAEVLTVRIGTPLEEIERRVTFATLASCGNVKRRAAEILGISLKTLYNRLEAYAKAGASVPGEPAPGSASSSAENRPASVSAPLSAGPGYAQPGSTPAVTPGVPHPG